MSIKFVWPISVHEVPDMGHLPDDAVVLSVNDKVCVGRCGVCKKPVTYDENYELWKRGSVSHPICQKCADDAKSEQMHEEDF